MYTLPVRDDLCITCALLCLHWQIFVVLAAVLGVSLLLEGYSLLVAVRTVTAGAAAAGLPFAEFVRRGMDPTSIAVMMEDGAACAGLLIAGASLSCILACTQGFGAHIPSFGWDVCYHFVVVLQLAVVVSTCVHIMHCMPCRDSVQPQHSSPCLADSTLFRCPIRQD